eukprot:TRINITY_DN10354_c0_g1_i1.p1 TRINITY_DN10354_c0_g1~~TRINITY_DN10354_c0_g1_i1.p1  ORF type:complete len:269 (-),score=54.03 TRINITY_DN10354_c0_g1_i1:53-823(-)
MDKEGWYSVTPEAIAQHISNKFLASLGPNALVIDAMAGVGGNSIQFATKFPMAFGFDLSFERLSLTKHNAAVYGVQDRLELIRGDATCLAQNWRTADAVFFSPPWGGPEYSQQAIFDLSTMTPSAEQLFSNSRQLTPNVAFLLPKQTSITQLSELARKAAPAGGKAKVTDEFVEVEEAYLNDRLKMLTVYYGNLACNAQPIEEEEVKDQENEIQPLNEGEVVEDECASTSPVLGGSNKKKRRRSGKRQNRKKQKVK